MDVGDPLTEAVCWNAAWQMVTAAELAAADFADLVIRRLGTAPPALPALSGSSAARAGRDRRRPVRAGYRTGLALRALAGVPAGAGAAAAGSPAASLAAGFAPARPATAGAGAPWLAGGSRPDGLVLDGTCACLLRTLAARGLATDEDLDGLVAADPVGGEQNLATCRACGRTPGQGGGLGAALAEARTGGSRGVRGGVWVPGQDELMAGYVDRLLHRGAARARPRPDAAEAEAGPAALSRHARQPADDRSGRGGAGAWRFSDQLRTIVLERQEMLRSVLAVRRGGALSPLSSNAAASAGTSTEYCFSTASGTICSARSCVEASTTGAAAPSW